MTAAIAVDTMYDTIHADAGHIPADAVKVAGYVTGTADILWTASDWARFPHAGKVRIDQSPAGAHYANGDANVYDIEANAGTVAQFAVTLAPSRHQRGMTNCPYSSRSGLASLETALDAVKADGWWHGMDAWLADPSLSLAEATRLIGTILNGFKIRAVQWAWPSTNPDNKVPGGTLGELNLDLSVTDAAWYPATAPVPPAWPVQALAAVESAAGALARAETLLKAHQ